MRALARTRMPIYFDDSIHPNVLITITGNVDADEYERYHERLLSSMRGAKQSGVKIGIVVDGRNSQPPGAKERRRMAQFLEDHSALLAETVSGQAIVLSNALQRGVLTAILWVRPFPMPHLVCATPAEGLAWVRSLSRSAA